MSVSTVNLQNSRWQNNHWHKPWIDRGFKDRSVDWLIYLSFGKKMTLLLL